VTDERALLERARRYDEAALGQLYDRYAPRVYAYVYRRVGHAALAEDLTGDVFVRVLRAIRSERMWRTSFRAWLYRIAHNVVVDHYRRQPQGVPVPLDEVQVAAGGDSLPDLAQDALNWAWLHGAVRRLTPEQQEVLALRFGEGLTARETARVLRKTTGAVEALQRRALAALRRLLVRQRRALAELRRLLARETPVGQSRTQGPDRAVGSPPRPNRRAYDL
jgi:RNA polymerase sigma-70 factor (ECF subfamily)